MAHLGKGLRCYNEMGWILFVERIRLVSYHLTLDVFCAELRFVQSVALAAMSRKLPTRFDLPPEEATGPAAQEFRASMVSAAGKAWSTVRTATQNASGEAKATTAGAAAGGVVASTAGTHIGIAAFGTAVSGAALLPVAATVGVGAIAGYAVYKLAKDIKAKRSEPVVPIAQEQPKVGTDRSSES